MKKSGVLLVLALSLSPAPILYAQQPPLSSPMERVSLGVSVTGVVGALPWAIVSGRLSAPLGGIFGLDVDVGTAVGVDRLRQGQVPTGAAVDVHVRWLHSGRAPSGRAGYVFAGPRFVAAENHDARGSVIDRDPVRVVDIGYGIDRVIGRRLRSGVEFGAGGGEGPFLFVNGFFVWSTADQRTR